MEIKEKIKQKIEEGNFDAFVISRHIDYDDTEVFDYMRENEFDIEQDDFGLFQKNWNESKEIYNDLVEEYGESNTKEILQELTDEGF